MTSSAAITASDSCFSGAAPVKVRKEGASVRFDVDGVVELQWGRTREGAEGSRKVECCRWLPGGFSGAAPVKVRKATWRSRGATCLRSLQWGRTREGAEGMESLPAMTPPLICFSGAAPVKVRKGSHSRLRTTYPSGRFSGAAPVKVRKVSLTRKVAQPKVWLQWGRTREGAEGGRCAILGNAFYLASVGPHP